MVLKEGLNGHTYRVLSIQIELQLERRLEALGLTDGSLITILNNDKHGAPVSYTHLHMLNGRYMRRDKYIQRITEYRHNQQ